MRSHTDSGGACRLLCPAISLEGSSDQLCSKVLFKVEKSCAMLRIILYDLRGCKGTLSDSC